MRFLFYYSIVISCFFVSCSTQSRVVYNYLDDVNDTSAKNSIFIKQSVIQPNDLLHIQVYSVSIKPEIDALYNLPVYQNVAGGGGQSNAINGFLVDINGNIEYPRLGTIHAAGLTKNQLAELIKSRLEGELKQPSVIVRFLNYRITVLGEVGNPGVLTVPTEKLTILEAIGMAGDITEFGKKKEVKILRENNGIQQIGILDVTSKSMFQSPYYQLQQNDVVFVEQTRYKVRQTERERISQQLTFGLSIITSIALLYSIFR